MYLFRNVTGFIVVFLHFTCIASQGPTISAVTGPVIHGEGPYWNAKERALYFVDISGQNIYRYDTGSGQVTSFLMDGPVTFVMPVDETDGCLLIGRGRDLVYVKWDGSANTTLTKITAQLRPDEIGCSGGQGEGVVLASVEQTPGKKGNRFNDAKADKSGRLWAGTMGHEANGSVDPRVGTLYSLETNVDVPRPRVTHVDISNGMTWNADNTVMYYIDSTTRRIDAFDFNVTSGTIANRRAVFHLDRHNLTGVPDGMTIDGNGHLWVALYSGRAVIKVDPVTGDLVQLVAMPCDYVTSVTFGERDLDTLYVTTSRRDLTADRLAAQPAAGAVFAVRGLGERGMLQDNAVRRDNLMRNNAN